MEEQVITVNLPFTFVVGEIGEQIGRPILTIGDAEEEVMLKLEYDDYEMFFESSIN